MEFELEDGLVFPRPNAATLDAQLRILAPDSRNSFAILTLSDGDYMQTACEGDGYVIERQSQDPVHHFRAVRPAGGTLFTIDEVIAAFAAFAYEPAHPLFLVWESMDDELGISS